MVSHSPLFHVSHRRYLKVSLSRPCICPILNMWKAQQSISLSRKPNPIVVSPRISPLSTRDLSAFRRHWGNGVFLLLLCQSRNHSGVHFLRALTSPPRHRYSSVCLRAWGHLIHILQAGQLIACLPQKPTFAWTKTVPSSLETHPRLFQRGILRSFFVLTAVQSLLVFSSRPTHVFLQIRVSLRGVCL